MITPIQKESFWTDDELGLLYILDEALHSTLDLDDLFFIILTAATAGSGFSFSRAALFLVDEKRKNLEGKMGIGPTSAEDAGRIWSRLARENPRLQDLLFSYASFSPDSPFNQMVARFVLPLDSDNICTQVLRDGNTYLLSKPYEPHLVPKVLSPFLLGSQFVITAIPGRFGTAGILVGDNAFSSRAISERQVQLLAFFAKQAGSILELVSMNRALQEKVAELKESYLDLYEVRHRLLRSEKLATIGQAITYVGHELREPVTVIGGLAKSINRGGLSEEDIKNQSQLIYQKTVRLARFINFCLNFVRLGESQSGVCYKINALVEEVCAEVLAGIKEEGSSAARIEQALKPDIPPVCVDTEQVKHVLVNVIENSLHSVAGLPAGEILLGGDWDKDWVRISVADNGVGIRNEDIDKVFEPFFTTRPGGCGLGLAFARQILETLEGRITAESEGAGKGATFTIYLPRKEKT
ncbi:MAG: ATP-binding protein [Candidatus Omnitrophota bacterium]